jgi:hypothetical protein
MDHNEAIRLQGAVKYVLGELSPAQREEYEEHYFDCAECAVDIQAWATFADTTRELLRRERETERAKDLAAARGGWLSWLQPVVAIPAMAALLLIIAYQNTVTIPKSREEGSSGNAQIAFSSYPLRGVNTAGDEGRTLLIRPGEALLLNFDFVPARSFDNYVGQLEDAAGRVLLKLKIAGGNANQEAHLSIPAGVLHPGKYVLAFYGDLGASGKADPKNDAGRLPFTVEFRP